MRSGSGVDWHALYRLSALSLGPQPLSLPPSPLSPLPTPCPLHPLPAWLSGGPRRHIHLRETKTTAAGWAAATVKAQDSSKAMDSLTSHPSTAAQAKAFSAPNSLSLPGGTENLSMPVKEGAAVNGTVAPSTPAATPGDAGPIVGVSGLVPTLQWVLPPRPAGLLSGTRGHVFFVNAPRKIKRNIVATVNLDCRLDLKTIALHARNAEYNPKRFAAVIMRIREPKTTALIFAS